MLVNTQEFRREALYFNKYKRYDDGEVGSSYWYDWWDEQQRRSLEGYKVGDVRVSGYNYFYLNFCPIWLVRARDYGVFTKNKPKNARRAGDRIFTFPDFWDEDFRYFTSLDIAEYGITFEDYRKLPVSLDLIEDEENFSGGHHLTWLKPRGCGASYKGGSLPTRNYACIEGSKSYLFAFEKEYLTKDGILDKFFSFRDFINQHASGFADSGNTKDDNTKMHYEDRNFKSSVFGVSLKDDTDKARGKRGKIILVEEAGKFPGLLEVMDKSYASVQELDVNFGTIVVFGTGGAEKDTKLEGLRSLFYNPAANNMLRFKNVYDEGMYESECSMFTPAYRNVQEKDKDGNSDEKTTRIKREKERKLAEKSTDPLKLARVKAEDPFSPEEALLDDRANIFSSPELIKHKKFIEATGRFNTIPVKGKLTWIGQPRDRKVKFTRDDTLKPVWDYPIKTKNDNTGSILLYEEPYKVNGKIPEYLYTVNVDAYRFDETTGQSVGAIYVMKSANNFTPDRGQVIAASYVGRPSDQEEFNHVVFQLALYYNAKIAFENDEPGDIPGYAKRNKMTSLLQDEFRMAYDEKMAVSRSTRKFGVRIAGGRDNTRKKQGDIYLKKMLYTPRFITEEGKTYYNFHMINDLGLLRELCNYNLDGNFDRVSAMRVFALFEQELLYEELAPETPRKDNDPLSLENTTLYTNERHTTQTSHPAIEER